MIARLVALECLEDHALERDRARVETAALVLVENLLPDDRAGGLVERRQHRALRGRGPHVQEAVHNRGRTYDAGALSEAAAFPALAKSLAPDDLAGVGVQRVDVAELGSGVDAAVRHRWRG